MDSKYKLLVLSDIDSDFGNLDTLLKNSGGFEYEFCKTEAEMFKLLSVENSNYDLVILSTNSTTRNHVELIKEIRSNYKDLKTFLITQGNVQAMELMLHGAAGLVFKNDMEKNLVDNIQKILDDKRSSYRFELQECDIKITLLNEEGVRIQGYISNVSNEGLMIDFEDLAKAKEYFNKDHKVDVLFQPTSSEPLVKIFRGNVVRIYESDSDKSSMGIYLTPEKDLNFIDNFVGYFK